jgi:hypothetical protein
MKLAPEQRFSSPAVSMDQIFAMAAISLSPLFFLTDGPSGYADSADRFTAPWQRGPVVCRPHRGRPRPFLLESLELTASLQQCTK